MNKQADPRKKYHDILSAPEENEKDDDEEKVVLSRDRQREKNNIKHVLRDEKEREEEIARLMDRLYYAGNSSAGSLSILGGNGQPHDGPGLPTLSAACSGIYEAPAESARAESIEWTSAAAFWTMLAACGYRAKIIPRIRFME